MATTETRTWAEEQIAKADAMPLTGPPEWTDCNHCHHRKAAIQLCIGSSNMRSITRLCRVCADRIKAAL